MKIIADTVHFYIDEPAAVAIGKFDGVHLGHRKLIEALKQQKGLAAVVFTFDPSPAVFFGAADKELSTREEKRAMFGSLGVDYLVEFPLTKETAAIPPEHFIRDILSERLQCRFVAAGSDLSFGAGGKGNFALLERLAVPCGYRSLCIEKVSVDGTEVSSTKIRELIAEGKVAEAGKMLGAPYQIQGRIVEGNRIGRTIGVPTINQIPPQDKLLPPFGVYYSDVEIGGELYHGMTNIGVKPTIGDDRFREGSARLTAETYLYYFDGDLYGTEARTMLREFRRPERKFGSLEELRHAMDEDIRAGEQLFACL